MKTTIFSFIILASYGISFVTSETMNPLLLSFNRLGSYETSLFKKDYYIPKNIEVNWVRALFFCNTHGLELLTLKSVAEQNHFLKLLHADNVVTKTWIMHIGGVRIGKDKNSDFYGYDSQHSKLSKDLKWGQGEPSSNEQPCLSIYKHVKYLLNDSRCNDEIGSFVCQHVNYKKIAVKVESNTSTAEEIKAAVNVTYANATPS